MREFAPISLRKRQLLRRDMAIKERESGLCDVRYDLLAKSIYVWYNLFV